MLFFLPVLILHHLLISFLWRIVVLHDGQNSWGHAEYLLNCMYKSAEHWQQIKILISAFRNPDRLIIYSIDCVCINVCSLCVCTPVWLCMPDGYYVYHYRGFVVQFPGHDILSVIALSFALWPRPPPLAEHQQRERTRESSPLWKWPDLALSFFFYITLASRVSGTYWCFCLIWSDAVIFVQI